MAEKGVLSPILRLNPTHRPAVRSTATSGTAINRLANPTLPTAPRYPSIPLRTLLFDHNQLNVVYLGAAPMNAADIIALASDHGVALRADGEYLKANPAD